MSSRFAAELSKDASPYPLPGFLVDTIVTPAVYRRWLSRKALAHMQRDRKRGNPEATRTCYMQAIHSAVNESGGVDDYTGQPLAWESISTYDNASSKAGRRAYKQSFCDLPTVDHVGDGLGPPDFKICSWRTNDCKSDLTAEELLEFCRAVLAHHETRSTLMDTEVTIQMVGCRCCAAGIPRERPRICPECRHQFRGNGWDGIDAHWRAKHEQLIPYEDFWSGLCPAHRL